jgi:hypothetical protein
MPPPLFFSRAFDFKAYRAPWVNRMVTLKPVTCSTPLAMRALVPHSLFPARLMPKAKGNLSAAKKTWRHSEYLPAMRATNS